MKLLTTIIKKFLPKELPKPVGRWRIESCNKQINYKVDLSNEDHCGPCGQYALEKTNKVSDEGTMLCPEDGCLVTGVILGCKVNDKESK